MCEFKVYLIDKKEVREVTEDVLFARNEDGEILLRNVIGMSETVPCAIISEVSVPSTKMTLITSPILADLLKFLEVQQKCYENETYDPELTNVWESLKKKGDAFLLELKKEFNQGT